MTTLLILASLLASLGVSLIVGAVIHAGNCPQINPANLLHGGTMESLRQQLLQAELKRIED